MALKIAEFEKRMDEVVRLKYIFETRKEVKKQIVIEDEDPKELDYELHKQRSSERKKKHKRRKSKKVLSSSSTSSSSSSSSYSSSSSDEYSEEGEVEEYGRSGIFSCPFVPTDTRGPRNVKRLVRGSSASRKYIRIALHNLYENNYTMTSLATSVVNAAYSSAFSPVSTDVTWLNLHAQYLDGILLDSLDGPWTHWNEPCLDNIVKAFLEFLVRVSGTKEYPMYLDYRVRKWMRKNRVGANFCYGPVPYYMRRAKFTNHGLVLF